MAVEEIMDQAKLKEMTARAAVEHVENGMKLGIGSGSTAEAFVAVLAERVRDGLQITGVPTSERTASLCTELGVGLSTLDEEPSLDLTIDGADEIDGEMSLIKGGGGALLREKIVASASASMIVIADQTKLVEHLGAFALPIEVNRFGLRATRLAIEAVAQALDLPPQLSLRMDGETPFVTDGGHLIIDASFGLIRDARALSTALHAVPGVVEHGLFIGMARKAIIAAPEGVRIVE